MSINQSLTREEVAHRDLGTTQISAALARFLVIVFLVGIAAVPAIQLAREMRSATEATHPGALSVLRDLDDRFWLKTSLQPLQAELLHATGLATESVYAGQAGWLFFRADIEHVTGPGFLQPRSKNFDDTTQRTRQDDPVAAIVDFHRQLAARDIRLIVMPIPSKPMIHPDRLSSRFAAGADPLFNASHAEFLARLNEAGVRVCDVTSDLVAETCRSGQPQFLATDTHWTPAAVELSARRLAGEVSRTLSSASENDGQECPSYKLVSQSVSNTGDLAAMLHREHGAETAFQETVSIRRVVANGADWQPAHDAEVLLLGDSFTNIYSLPEMNWGSSAGLAEQLSFELQRQVDCIAQNDNGALATRQAFVRELAGDSARFRRTRVLVWQFAVRELSQGDWQLVPLPARGRKQSPSENELAGSSRVVRARVAAVGVMPAPGTVPYREALLAVHLEADRPAAGADADAGVPSSFVVYLWGMRDNRWTSAAQLRPGTEISLRLTLWREAEKAVGRFARAELDDPDFLLVELPTFFGELEP